MLQLSYIIVILYSISILLFYFIVAHFNLLLNYLKVNKDQSPNMTFLGQKPYVTIQLPIL
jgi:hypothetical protein